MSISDVLRTVSLFLDSTGKQLKIGGYRPDHIDPSDKKFNHICRRGLALLNPYRVVYLPENSCKSKCLVQ